MDSPPSWLWMFSLQRCTITNGLGFRCCSTMYVNQLWKRDVSQFPRCEQTWHYLVGRHTAKILQYRLLLIHTWNVICWKSAEYIPRKATTLPPHPILVARCSVLPELSMCLPRDRLTRTTECRHCRKPLFCTCADRAWQDLLFTHAQTQHSQHCSISTYMDYYPKQV